MFTSFVAGNWATYCTAATAARDAIGATATTDSTKTGQFRLNQDGYAWFNSCCYHLFPLAP